MDRQARLVAAGAVALAAAFGVYFGAGSPVPMPVAVSGGPPSSVAPGFPADGSAPASGTVTVHVAGWVARPGLVRLAEGSRVADAVAAAGGARAGAALAAVNLAEPVIDGSRVVVPGPESGEAGGLPLAPPDDGKVHLNLATVEELDRLPGVGPVLAERIAAYREAHGPFARVEDLLDVPGIGEAKLAALRDSVVVP
jgi:competence protein ComEA